MNEPNITVFYEKFYIDSVSRHIPSLFDSNKIENITIKRYWRDSIDGFLSYPCTVYLTCISGDVRIVIPYGDESGWNFTQYFVSEMDGKVVKIPHNTWFGIHNMRYTESTVVQATSKKVSTTKRMDYDIFNWND